MAAPALAADTASKSCDAFLKDGSGEADCKTAVIASTRKTADDVIKYLTSPVPGLVNPMGGLSGAGIRQACDPLARLTDEDLTTTVIIADACLKAAYKAAVERSDQESAGMVTATAGRLAAVAKKLIALSKP